MKSSQLYDEWENSPDKDDLKFYGDAGFRRRYAQEQIDSNARTFKRMVAASVEGALGYMLKFESRNQIRILSLGCGPGSDILGVLQAIKSAVKRRYTNLVSANNMLKCHCTGVDAFDWDQEKLKDQIRSMEYRGVFGGINYEFVKQDMETFVHDGSVSNGLIDKEFDFICLSFADAGRNMQLVGAALPKLLSVFGCVLVLDNDISSVKLLKESGFECTFSGNNISMHVRCRDYSPSRCPFKPSDSSPISTYRRHYAYPYGTRIKSWCETLCNIL